MKAFTQKLNRSLVAMSYGWIACNIAWWVGYFHDGQGHEWTLTELIWMVLRTALGTAFVIQVTWLAVFLPVDVIVPDGSPFRKFWISGLCGFIAGSAVIVLPWVWSFWPVDLITRSLEDLQWKALPFLLSPGITGMVAAIVRSRDSHPSADKS